MKTKFAFAALTCAVLTIVGCGSSPQNLILGKWEVENAPMKMTAEFRPDGMAKITIFGQTLQGKYKLSDDDELEWSMNGMSTRGKVNVTATELEITDSENRTIKYRRKVN